jgi:hypothetical protein
VIAIRCRAQFSWRVAAAVESVALVLAGAGFEWCDAGVAGELCVCLKAVDRADLSQQLRGAEWATAGKREQRRGCVVDARLQFAIEGEDAAGQVATAANELARNPDLHRLLGASQPTGHTVEPERAVERAGRDRELRVEVVQLIGSSNDILVVDPRTVTPAEPPPGVELSPLSAFEDDPSPIHHVDSVAFLDEPGDLTLDALSLERWLEHYWSHPLLDREVSMVAVVDGTSAALTYVQTDRATGRGTNSGTATLTEHRGRSLATLAKRASLVRAAQLGIKAVYTGNDVTNAPMQAINRKFGYEPCSTMLSFLPRRARHAIGRPRRRRLVRDAGADRHHRGSQRRPRRRQGRVRTEHVARWFDG